MPASASDRLESGQETVVKTAPAEADTSSSPPAKSGRSTKKRKPPQQLKQAS